MAVVYVKELPSERTYTSNDDAVREYVSTFLVYTDTPNTGLITLADDPALPALFDTYDSAGDNDADSRAKVKSAQQEGDNPLCFRVRVEYSNQTKPADFGNVNPLLRPVVEDGNTNRFQRIAIVDVNGLPIANSAGDQFDPPAEMEDSRVGFTLSRYFADAYDRLAVARAYRDTVNQDTFHGCDAGTVRFVGMRWREEYFNGARYWQVTFEFEVKEEGWNLVLVDQGVHIKVNLPVLGNKKVTVVDPFGEPVRQPVPLDGAGGVLAVGGTVVNLSFQIYFDADFGSLGV